MRTICRYRMHRLHGAEFFNFFFVKLLFTGQQTHTRTHNCLRLRYCFAEAYNTLILLVLATFYKPYLTRVVYWSVLFFHVDRKISRKNLDQLIIFILTHQTETHKIFLKFSATFYQTSNTHASAHYSLWINHSHSHLPSHTRFFVHSKIQICAIDFQHLPQKLTVNSVILNL